MQAKSTINILLVVRKRANPSFWSPEFRERLSSIGELTLLEDTADWTDETLAARCREFDVILTDWATPTLPVALAHQPGRLRYICHAKGSIRDVVPRRLIEKGIVVSNWGDIPADGVAEGAFALLLTVLKQVIPQVDHVRAGGWSLRHDSRIGSLHDLRVGIYGLGVIGRRFVELATPFKPRLSGFDPYLKDWPKNVVRAESLDDLCDGIHCLVVTAGLTDETRTSLTARHFGKLPDGGIVINVARGGILDQPALFAELEKGRLRAGLDVLDTDGKDFLPEEHPARSWPNLLLTTHRIGNSLWNPRKAPGSKFSLHQQLIIENLDRFVSGKPLLNTFDLERYDRST